MRHVTTFLIRVHLIVFQGNEMHENETAGDEREEAGYANDRIETTVLDLVGGCASRDADDATDFLIDATLTERVVGFLEQYNPSVFEFG